MSKTSKLILFILKCIAATVLYVVIFSTGKYLLNKNIVDLKYEFFTYIYYFGLGLLSYYPVNAIFKDKHE